VAVLARAYNAGYSAAAELAIYAIQSMRTAFLRLNFDGVQYGAASRIHRWYERQPARRHAAQRGDAGSRNSVGEPRGARRERADAEAPHVRRHAAESVSEWAPSPPATCSSPG